MSTSGGITIANLTDYMDANAVCYAYKVVMPNRLCLWYLGIRMHSPESASLELNPIVQRGSLIFCMSKSRTSRIETVSAIYLGNFKNT